MRKNAKCNSIRRKCHYKLPQLMHKCMCIHHRFFDRAPWVQNLVILQLAQLRFIDLYVKKYILINKINRLIIKISYILKGVISSDISFIWWTQFLCKQEKYYIEVFYFTLSKLLCLSKLLLAASIIAKFQMVVKTCSNYI